MILAFTGAELAGGADSAPPPSSAHNSGPHSRARVKFRKQAAIVAAKANQVLAVIKRSFELIDACTLPLLYNALVCPHLEFGNVIWGPFNRADQLLVEHVQWRATLLVSSIRLRPHGERLEELGLPSCSTDDVAVT